MDLDTTQSINLFKTFTHFCADTVCNPPYKLRIKIENNSNTTSAEVTTSEKQTIDEFPQTLKTLIEQNELLKHYVEIHDDDVLMSLCVDIVYANGKFALCVASNVRKSKLFF